MSVICRFGEQPVGILFETVEKEVQDTSCRGSGGVPQLKKPPPRLGE